MRQHKVHKLIISALVLFASQVLMSCGKKAEVHERRKPVIDEVQGDEIEAQLAKQRVVCDQGLACPPNLAKVVVVNGRELKSCTGFLVNSVTLATTASCLTDLHAAPMAPDRCAKDVHIFLASSGVSPAVRLRCKEIIFTTNQHSDDPTLWRSDIAYLNLEVNHEETRGRRQTLLSREGMEDRKTLSLWKVDEESAELGVIRRQDCQVITKSYVNPLSDSPFSPVMTLMGCAFRRGNSGGMLQGADGRWHGILSQPLSDSMRDFLQDRSRGLLVEPLAPLVHVSNGACLPSVIESNVPTERDCFRDLDEQQVIRRRFEMLDNDGPYQASRVSIARQVDAVRGYFKWDVELTRQETGGPFHVTLVPRCLNPLEGWLERVGRREERFTYSMNLPDWRLSLGLDAGARFVGRLDGANSQRVFVQFSPKSVAETGRTTIKVWKSGQVAAEFRNITLCE